MVDPCIDHQTIAERIRTMHLCSHVESESVRTGKSARIATTQIIINHGTSVTIWSHRFLKDHFPNSRLIDPSEDN